MNRFRGGLVLEAHRLVYHSTLGSRVMKKKRSSNTAMLVYGKRENYIKLVTSDRKLKASREGSKGRIYGTLQKRRYTMYNL